jgi:hypothetical protein
MSAKKKSYFDIILKRGIGRTVCTGLAAAGLATALTAGTAEAQDTTPFGEASIFVGYTWGAGGGINWGIEGRAGADFRGQWACTADPAFSAAGVARFGFVDLRPQLHIGGQAGVVQGFMSWMGDVGLGYRWGENGGFSVPIGMELQIFVAQTYFRADPVLREISTGAGAFLPAREGDMFGCAIAGRPLYDEEGYAALPKAARLEETDRPHDMDPELADVLAAEWERRARAEWGSVPAFLQLAAQLRAVGAPLSLVARAYDAAEDELRHAVGTGRASVVYSGAPIGLGPVTPETRAHARGKDALVRLAVESWVDGCLGEGKAAHAAGREARLAETPALRELLAMIAVDEANHAELAWDVLAWAIAAGGDDVRHALAAVREASPMEATGAETDHDLRAHGLLSEPAHRRIGEEVREAMLPRFDALVG